MKRSKKVQNKPVLIYKKTDLYINWNVHAPLEWKFGIIWNLVKQTKIIGSKTTLLLEKIGQLKRVFIEVNEHPIKTLKRTVNQTVHHRDKSKNTIIKNDRMQKKFK